MDLPFVKEAVKGMFSKTSCEMYPFVPSEAAPRYRGRIVFHPEKCINCGMCERVCAGGAIKTEAVPVEGGQQITRTFNLGSCTFCSHCADFCHEKAIELTGDYHMVATKEEDLLVSGTFFKAAPKKSAPKPAAPKAEAAAPAAAGTIKPRDDGKPVQVPFKCVYCTLCAKKCPAGALTVDRAAKTWVLDEDACCPKKAILMPGDDPVAPPAPAGEAPKAAAPKVEAAAPAAEKPAEAAPVQPRDDGKPVQDPSKCVYCTLCAKKCPAGALTVDRAAKTWVLDEDACGRGRLRWLRHLRRRLPEGRHRHVNAATNKQAKQSASGTPEALCLSLPFSCMEKRKRLCYDGEKEKERARDGIRKRTGAPARDRRAVPRIYRDAGGKRPEVRRLSGAAGL